MATELSKIIWRDEAGAPLSCVEKIKVLEESLTELTEMAQDTLEDALLMGASEQQARAVMADLIAALENPYAK